MSGQAEKLNSATLQPQNVTNDDRPIESPPPSIPTDLDFSVPDMPVVLLEPKIFSSFGLRWLSDYYRSDVRREYGARMAVFEATRAIPERDKDVIRSRVSYAVGVLKADEAWMEAVRYCVNWFYDGVFRAGWVMVPTIVSFWLWSGLAKLELVLFTAISLILWIGAGLDAKSKRRRSMLDASLMLLFVAWPVLLVLGIWRWKTDGRWEALAILLSSISICRLVGVVANFSLSLANAKLAVALFLGTLAVVYVSSAYYLSAVVMWIAKGLGSEILIITVIGLLLLSLLSRLGPRRQSRSRSPGGPMLGSLVYLSALGLGYILANQAPEQSAPRWMTEGVQGGLWASIVILLLLGSLNVATSIFRSVLGFIVYRKYPHFDIIDELILLLDWIDWSGADWESPAYRSRIADELEYLARRFERSLPLSLRSHDHLTSNWVLGQAAVIGAKVRTAKRRVLLEGLCFRDELRTAVGETLLRAAAGEWLSLVPNEEESEKVQSSLKVRTLAIVRNLMVALLPLGIALGLQLGPFTDLVSSDLAAKLTPFAFIWLALGVLSWLDPRSEKRISGTKEVMNIGGFLGRTS